MYALCEITSDNMSSDNTCVMSCKCPGTSNCDISILPHSDMGQNIIQICKVDVDFN